MELYFVEKGQGEPLILLHGNGGSHEEFVHQIDFFSAFYHVYALDTRGHGQSPRGEGPFSLYRFREDLLEFVDSQNIQKAHLLGFSDGGNIALLFALKYPDRVNKLILNGANLYEKGVCTFIRKEIHTAYETALSRLPDPDAKAQAEMTSLMIDQPNISPHELHALPHHTLVIVGTKDLILPRHSKMMARHIPKSQLVFVEGGHDVARGNPHAFNAHVLAFLQNKSI